MEPANYLGSASAQPPLHSLRKKLFVTVFFGIGWVIAVAFGLRVLLNYDSTPGRVGAVSQSWQSASAIQRTNDRPTLVMFAHPHCPCTRASVGELAEIMAHVQGRVSANVLFVRPKGAADDWDETDLRRSAAAIPGVRVSTDVDGLEARRFGAETSGHTLLFDRDGHLVFSGGITQSRGHAGGNAGESAIVSLVNNHRPARSKTFVFGCSLARHTEQKDNSICLK